MDGAGRELKFWKIVQTEEPDEEAVYDKKSVVRCV